MIRRVLILLLCITLINVSAFAREDYGSYFFEAADYTEAITFLEAIGILSPAELEEIDEWTISRGEFVELAIRCIGQKDAAKSAALSGVFADIDKEYEYADSIMYAAKSNLLGDYNGLIFKPEEPLDIELAARLAVCMTGRSVMVNSMRSYVKVAYQEEFFDDVELYSSDKLSRGGAYTFLKNVLSANIVTSQAITSGGAGKFSEEKGVNILQQYLGIEKREGVVTSDALTTVFGEKAEPGFLSIDGNHYLTAYASAEGLAGKYAEYYIAEEDGQLVIKYIEAKDNRILVLDNESLIKYDKATVSYVADVDGIESFNISRDAYISYNFEPYYSPEKMIPENGVVTLIDHNKDKKYDVVIVEDFTNTVFDTYSEYSETIYDLKDSSRNIDMSGYSDYNLIDSNGAEVSPGEINKYSIVSLFETADGKKARIIVTHNKKTGEISEADYEEGVFVVGSQMYSLSGDMRFDRSNITLGTNYEFYLDVRGEITYLETNYGEMAYLITAYKHKGMSNEIEIQVLPEDKKALTVYKLADKIKLTTPSERKTVKKADLYKDYLVDAEENTIRQMMLIRVNGNDEVSHIVTSYEISKYEQIATAPEYPLYYMSYLVSEWPSILGSSATEMDWKYTSGGFNRWIIMGSGVQMFYVPQMGEEVEDEEAVTVENIDYGTSTTGSLPKKNITFYSKDKDDVSVRYMVNYAAADDSNELSTMWPCVVVDMKMVYNESINDFTWRIKLEGAGSNYMLFTRDESVVLRENLMGKENVRATKTRVEVGDVVRFAKDASGNIRTMSLIWDATAGIDDEYNDNGDTSARFGAITIDPQKSWNQGGWLPIPGNILRKSGNVIEILADKNEYMSTFMERLQRVRWGVHNTNFIVDYSERKPVVIRNADASELVPGDRVVILSKDGQTYTLAAYRR